MVFSKTPKPVYKLRQFVPNEVISNELREKYGIWMDNFECGEGMNRIAFKGGLPRKGQDTLGVVVCLPKAEQTDSVQNKINQNKRNRDEREAEILTQIKPHPNIVGFVGSYNIGGHTINISELGAEDLETLVSTKGKIKDQKLADVIIYQSLLGLEETHKQGFLHRDIKPSNITADLFDIDFAFRNKKAISADAVKILDFQYAVKKDEVQELSMPTRGCSEYAKRNLINALFTGVPTKADEKSYLYALGGTFYYILTGQNPGDYKVIRDESGKEVIIDGERVKVSLVRKSKDGKIIEKLEKIDDEKDEMRLKNLTAKVPIAYRDFVYRCMTSGEDGFKNVSEARIYFEKLRENPIRKAAYAVREGAKAVGKASLPFVLAAASVYALGSLFDTPRDTNRPYNPNEYVQEQREVMKMNNYSLKTERQRFQEMTERLQKVEYNQSH